MTSNVIPLPTSSQEFMPFEQMVTNLFKTTDMNRKMDALLHAFLGISTEVWELNRSNIISRENLIEEYGDLLFYVEAARQSLLLIVSREFGENDILAVRLIDLPSVNLPSISASTLEKEVGNAMDLVKKLWVYHKESAAIYERLYMHLFDILGILKYRFEIEGISAEDVIRRNQTKLGKRYPNGVYSNSDAIARADKDSAN